ncbi:response regulator transcription factor [Ramlibacter alkalitolerans]|uniref:Response regulator n=1 Tax=Ramlibacter alkalitolerans TaxID=2039631 RepID=A0ABS1JV03_9BURK|nr:response regulator [Ramlibacter alkalitolerans]MBL0428138.1 response regulator [Ramlibacter alkalitolerans]
MARVLLIEDDVAQRMIASFALRKAGHEVREAPDGEQGLVAARAAPPELVVCDVMMPGISGYEVVAAMRADPVLVNVPVVLLTAMSDRQHMRQGMTAGADDYLTKPYKPAELCEAIQAVLARREAQQKAFIDSMSGMVENALEQQKETLGRQYETRLQREINARWARSMAPGADVRYDHAFVLLADLLGSAVGAEPELAERLKHAQQTALDTFYLFGANHVLPYGSKVIAVFGGESSLTTPVELRAVRAAVALARSAGRERAISLGLHAGPISLVAVNDGLHGDHGQAPVPGDTMNMVTALEETAAASGWRVAVSPAVAGALEERVAFGRRSVTPRGEPAIEVVGLGA